MEVEIDEKELKAAGAEPLTDGRFGLLICGWEIESSNRPILTSPELLLLYASNPRTCDRQEPLRQWVDDDGVVASSSAKWEEKLKTAHLPEMIFGNSVLSLTHLASGTKISFNAFDALAGWKAEALPPVEVPAAAKWKFRSKPFEQVILDYDYTFTTPYGGSEMIDTNNKKAGACNLYWEDCEEKIDVAALTSKEPILFYDEVVLYEDELADSGVSLLTVKVRIMPSGWFLLLRYWLRVDGALMRLRDTRMHCVFKEQSFPVILRESCWREGTFNALATKGYPADTAAYNDPSVISPRLPVIKHNTQKLKLDYNP